MADTFPPDFESDIGRMRALIPDTEQIDFRDDGEKNYLFSDAHLLGLLSLQTSFSENANIKRAASNAVAALATSEAYISKVTKTEDLQTDGAKTANALLQHARQLNASADRDEDAENEEGFDIIEFRPMPPIRWVR